MTPQEQPDSQAGDEVDAIFDGLFEVPKSPTEMKAAVRDYAERLATERKLEAQIYEVRRAKANAGGSSEYYRQRIAELSATLTGEAKQ